MKLTLEDLDNLRRVRRRVQGISAVLLPYRTDGTIDEQGFRRHLRRTLDAGLRVAVNMDTGYADLLTPEEKRRVLQWTAETLEGKDWFVAGALPQFESGPPFGNGPPSGNKGGRAAYVRECAGIRERGGIPILFPSAYTAQLDDHALTEFFAEIARATDKFLAFELGAMFNPNGRIFPEPVLRSIVDLPQCCGLKHSSLERATEIERLQTRDRVRPDFAIYSGNDLAADMIEYGSDYLLGLSTFAPEAFAARDQAWAGARPGYLELRDAIQYLGWAGFRNPIPAYKHSAAIFLKLTHGLESDEPHPRAARREAWDWALLADAARRLERVCPRVSQPAFD